MLATSPDAVWWGGALVAAVIGAGFLLSGDRIPEPWKQVSPTSEKDLARRRKRLIDAGMRTWYGSRINDTALAELVAASEPLAAASATVMAARTGTTLRHVIDRGADIRS